MINHVIDTQPMRAIEMSGEEMVCPRRGQSSHFRVIRT